MSAHDNRVIHAGPVVDEWGFYDPDRAGLNALFDRLDAKSPAPLVPTADEAESMAASMQQATTLIPTDN
jgi:hypothetical protein